MIVIELHNFQLYPGGSYRELAYQRETPEKLFQIRLYRVHLTMTMILNHKTLPDPFLILDLLPVL